MPSADAAWRDEWSRARRFFRPLERRRPHAPVPPAGLPAGRVVELPGRGEVFVRERLGTPGQPTILLLHGWTASADLNWFRAYDAVSAHGRLLAVDHRGHGRGMWSQEEFSLEAAADDAAALLRTLETGPVIVVGYSMGGPISMLLWQRHPDLVDGLVLEATAMEWKAAWRERITFRFMAFLEYILRLDRQRGLIERTLRAAVEEAPELATYRDWIQAELRRGDPGAIAEAGRALGRFDARPFAGHIDVPTTIVVTTKDRLVRPRKQRQLARAVPAAQTVELAGDHDVCLVDGPGFARATSAAIVQVVERSVLSRRSTA